MRQILRQNALESWSMAIKYVDEIMEGKATFANRKYFVTALQNAVELFVKQYMLNQNDYRVARIKNIYNNEGEPLREYLAENNLNEYFFRISRDNEKMRKFYSVDFNDIVKWQKNLFSNFYEKNPTSDIASELKLLKDLRNNETHFYIDEADFLSDNQFEKLYNMMIIFYKILREYKLLPFIGIGGGRYECYSFERISLINFSYKNQLCKAMFVIKLKDSLENNIFPISNHDDAYEIASNIIFQCDELGYEFHEVWAYTQMLIKYKILKIIDYIDTEMIDGEEQIINSYCEYKIS